MGDKCLYYYNWEAFFSVMNLKAVFHLTQTHRVLEIDGRHASAVSLNCLHDLVIARLRYL